MKNVINSVINLMLLLATMLVNGGLGYFIGWVLKTVFFHNAQLPTIFAGIWILMGVCHWFMDMIE